MRPKCIKGIVVVAAVWIVAGCGDDVPAPTPSPAPEVTPQPPAPPPEPPPPTPEEMIAKQTTLADAIKMARPLMADTVGDVSVSAYRIAQWMNGHLNWPELKSLDTTNYKLVMKDPELERGKLLCTKVKIVQIQRDRQAPFPIYWGIGSHGWSDMIYYYAVGSTGDLVERSRATFCGVVIGTHSYPNVGGGTTHSVMTVGMFDLKDNRALGADPASPPAKKLRKKKSNAGRGKNPPEADFEL